VATTPANVPDQVPFLEMLDALPPVKMPVGRPRYKPTAALGDRAYGTAEIVAEVLQRRIESRLAPRSSQEHGSGLGKVRFVIERTMSWLGNSRRLKHCYERTGESWQAMNELAACVLCANRIQNLRSQGKIAA
jgi:DDE family transposase